jgi:sugar lactone lactonase YvrE
MTALVKGLALAVVVLAYAPSEVTAWDRGRARVFATLPDGSSGPEGLEVDSHGRVYVTTFGFTAAGAVSGEGQLFVFDDDGRLIRQVSIDGSSAHLLGLRFHPMTGALLVNDFGNGQVLQVDPKTGSSKIFMTLPSPLPHGTPPGAGLNDITFDRAGNVYVSDSFQGIVWKTGKDGGVASPWVDSPLLRTTGVPPFGANGLRFNQEETAMFVANTGDDTVIEIPAMSSKSGPVAGMPSVFTNSVNGADGLLIDDDDNLWVVANQADEIVVIDPTGKAISKLGDFGGLDDGSPIQMLFPASLRFHGKDLLVTNLSLDLRVFNASFVSVDSEWCAQVSRYTVVKIPARILGFSGGKGEDEDRDRDHHGNQQDEDRERRR